MPNKLKIPPQRKESRVADPAVAPSRVCSDGLLGASRELEILHQGEVYRLRRTRQGKLILTK